MLDKILRMFYNANVNDSHEGGMRMSSIQDVARLAGVSKTLVSRVINGQTGVSEKSREKILQAMRELQYRPNGIARSLVLKRTNTIGVALDSLCEPYFFELIEGIEQVVAQTDYDVVFCSGRNSKKLKNRSIQYFAQGRTDGVIIYGSKLDDEEIILQLQKSGFPSWSSKTTWPICRSTTSWWITNLGPVRP